LVAWSSLFFRHLSLPRKLREDQGPARCG